jgi:hypothetical protein
METVKLSTQLVNALLQYLVQQPYVQVVNLIAQIQKEAQEKPPAEE